MRKKLLLTLLCLIGIVSHAQVEIGTGSDTEYTIDDYILPLHMYYDYSYTQTIYKNVEVNAKGDITGLKWHYGSSSSTHDNEIEVYLGTTEKEQFASTEDWVALDELTKVFDGSVTFTGGEWIEITFDQAFAYNGEKNIVVAAREKTAEYDDQDIFFITKTPGETRSLSAYSDYTLIDPSTPPTEGGNDPEVTLSGFIPNVIFNGIEKACEPVTNVTIENISTEGADISWENTTGATVKIFYKEDALFNPTNDEEVMTAEASEASFSFTELKNGKKYYVYLQSTCPDSEEVVWAGPFEFRTKLGNVTPPYSTSFENEFPYEWTEESFSGKNWKRYAPNLNFSNVHEGSASMVYSFHNSEDADAWLYSNAFQLTKGHEYTVTFWVKAANATSAENLKLTVGSEPTVAGQTTTLLDLPDYANAASFEEKTVKFIPETTGVYHFAFHCYSVKDRYAIYIDDFSVTPPPPVFSLMESEVGDYWFSSIDWADYDNDGDADLLIAGGYPTEDAPYSMGTSTTHVYNNDGNGNLSLNEDIVLQGVHAGDAKWLDYDNDGDLDIVMIGIDFATAFNMYALYNNDNGNFTKVEGGANGVSWGTITTGDYDNDGDIDLLTSGWSYDTSSYPTFLWKNNNGTLEKEDISESLPGIFGGRIDWVDVDNDMDLDVVVSPEQDGAVSALRIFKQENREYTLAQSITNANAYSVASLGDYNNDGFIDVAVKTTDEDYNDFIEILKNNNGTFEHVTYLTGLNSSAAASPLAWGDYDNDGDLDLAIGGTDADYNGAALLYNNEDGEFTAIENTGFLPIGGHSLAWKDVDGDLNLDILITGFYDDPSNDEYYGTSRVYKNATTVANTAPEAPTTLSSEVNGYTATFNWSGATDAQTPETGLQYYLQVGTTPNGMDVAHYPVHGTQWMLQNLPEDIDKLYWCVKAIDTASAMSACSEEQTINNLAVNEVTSSQKISLYPNPAKAGQEVHLTGNIDSVKVITVTGQVLANTKGQTLHTNNWPAGVYLLKIKTKEGTTEVQKLIVN